MLLPAGGYRVRVSATNHETWEGVVRHGTEPTRWTVRLSAAIPRAGGTFADDLNSGGESPEMVVIPSGRFRMGCLNNDGDCNEGEKPWHEVRIPDEFALGRYEVTVGEFRGFVEATGYRSEAERDEERGCRTLENLGRNEWDWTPGRNWRELEYEVESDQPVTCVSWNDARAYVEWLSDETGEAYGLPSESEWEYAARAGTVTKYHFGDDAGALCEYGNVADSTRLPNGGVWSNGVDCSDGAVYPVRVGSYRGTDLACTTCTATCTNG